MRRPGSRAGDFLADCNYSLNIIINTAGTGEYRQLGHESVVGVQEAVLISSAEEVSCVYPCALRSLLIGLPRQSVSAMVRNPETMLCRPLPSSGALRLLLSYVQSTDKMSLDTPGLAPAFATHVQDLVALGIVATRDGKQLARGSGLRAARLAAINLDIGKSLGDSEFSIGALALRHGVTPRYIQRLFENDGTTFTHPSPSSDC
ncbi:MULTISPECIES: hypothetical protein [unclassified Bradyrhizobium]|uniref:AraC-like ligand-binding domain-containing protein n=1 Tax=unclassified Bradyrhizobium TaxID=2631580 RepID=UPI0007099C29|nr:MULTISPECIES: hypothetical protein [unclassified Bradyrhizobium]KQT09264.1 hypothetical protein ASG57_35520 [Bradyrhizobium sp. Leaf396]